MVTAKMSSKIGIDDRRNGSDAISRPRKEGAMSRANRLDAPA